MKVIIKIDNKSVISFVKNPIFRGRSKHIDLLNRVPFGPSDILSAIFHSFFSQYKFNNFLSGCIVCRVKSVQRKVMGIEIFISKERVRHVETHTSSHAWTSICDMVPILPLFFAFSINLNFILFSPNQLLDIFAT